MRWSVPAACGALAAVKVRQVRGKPQSEREGGKWGKGDSNRGRLACGTSPYHDATAACEI